ncbi:MAG: hypothetical protein Q4G39_08265 [Brachymonas sp.]|nr:hypothetical protein [Brachymonas sp.]
MMLHQHTLKFISGILAVVLFMGLYMLLMDRGGFGAVKRSIHEDRAIAASCQKISFIWPTNIRIYNDPKDNIPKYFWNARVFCPEATLSINYSSYKDASGKFIVEKNNPS